MLRILLILICIYILYKVLIPSKKGKKSRFRVVPPSAPHSQSLVVDEMKRCPSCGTFNPKSHALQFHGEYFCSEECKGKRV